MGQVAEMIVPEIRGSLLWDGPEEGLAFSSFFS